VLDSTETPVLQAGLEHLGGRRTINSVNYEDGDGPESRFVKAMQLGRRTWRRRCALTIDEEGQARTAEKKVETPNVSSPTSPRTGVSTSRRS
jgi:5-methyltetrahydrofolate--homocysteine methyltransferase